MSLLEGQNLYRQLRRLEHAPHVRTARKWLKHERKNHYGSLCLPLDDDLYLTAKGFALHTGTASDIFPPIPDGYPLMRLSRGRVKLMKSLRDNFESRKEQRDKAIRNIATQTNIGYVGALEIPTLATMATYAAYILCLPCAPVIESSIDLHLTPRWLWFRAGPVQKIDPILARAGCKKGCAATTKQLREVFIGP